MTILASVFYEFREIQTARRRSRPQGGDPAKISVVCDVHFHIIDDDRSRILLWAKDQTVWLTQREMSELFDVSTGNIGLHLKNLYEDEELSRAATTEESSVVQIEGSREVRRPLTLYKLDVILAVGYRVACRFAAGPRPSSRNTCSRVLRWATNA